MTIDAARESIAQAASPEELQRVVKEIGLAGLLIAVNDNIKAKRDELTDIRSASPASPKPEDNTAVEGKADGRPRRRRTATTRAKEQD